MTNHYLWRNDTLVTTRCRKSTSGVTGLQGRRQAVGVSLADVRDLGHVAADHLALLAAEARRDGVHVGMGGEGVIAFKERMENKNFIKFIQ